MNLKTSHKIFFATQIYRILIGFRWLFGKGSQTTVKRGGIVWNLDLNEGIDLAIYLFGRFELKTIRLYDSCIKEGDIVIDIGANIGSHTLPIAVKIGNLGKVYAFEPTRYAYLKLNRNIKLNPSLVDRISAYQIMLVETNNKKVEPAIYSSWPLEGNCEDLHEKHLGRLMDTKGAVSNTLDSWAEQVQLDQLDFIKIDVDGHEYSVLSGGRHILEKFKPRILMELAPYGFLNPDDFDQLIKMIRDLDYEIIDVSSRKNLSIDPNVLRSSVPDGSSRNVLLRKQ